MIYPLTITLIRHTKSQINEHLADTIEEALTLPPDMEVGLTDVGMEQGERVGTFLKTRRADFLKRVDAFRASPLARGMQMAARLRIPRAKWIPENKLRERDYGECYGWGPELVKERHPIFHRRREIDPLNARPPMGESISDVAEGRVRNLIEDLAKEGCRHALLVGHGDLIYAFLAYIGKLDPRAFAELYKPPYFGFGDIITFSRQTVNKPTVKIEDWYARWQHIRPLSDDTDGGWKPLYVSSCSNDELLRRIQEPLVRRPHWHATHGA